MFLNLSVKKAIVILAVLAVAGSIAVAYAVNNRTEYAYTTFAVKKGRIVQTVSETGTVKASDEIDLSFLNSGKLRKIYFNIGAEVNKDDILAELDYSSLNINKEEALANLDVAKENLRKLQSGATYEEKAIARANVRKAEAAHESAETELEKIKDSVAESINQAEKTLFDLKSSLNTDLTAYEQAVISAQTSLENTKITYQNSVNNKKALLLSAVEDKLALANTALDTFDRTITDEDGEDLISVKAPDYLSDAKKHNTKALSYLNAAKDSLAAAKTEDSNENVLSAGDDCLLVLDETFAVLKDCYSALENSVTSGSFTQSELDALKANISAQQTLISAAISSAQTAKQNFSDAVLSYNSNVSAAEESLKTAQSSYNDAVIAAENALASAKTSGGQQIAAYEAKVKSAEEALNVAQAELNRVIAPANQYDISLQQARIRQTQAVLDSIVKQIENSTVRAPIKGTITKINYEEGEHISLGSPAISILGENNFEIELLISEADITKVQAEDRTQITFDAFGEDVVFSGEVAFIEPAETIIQDVVYYKVKLSFDPGDKLIKSGMTANAIITTAEKDGVLIAPARAIVDRNGEGRFIRILENGKAVEKPATIGLRGDEGMVEIISGAEENDQVITYIKEE